MKNKKGFTLIELLAVIAILGLLATITGISVNRILRKSKTEINDIQMKMFEEAAKEYVLDHRSEYKNNGVYAIQISDLKDYIDGSIEGYNGYVYVTKNNSGYTSSGSTVNTGSVYDFDFANNYQTFTAPEDGNYQLEVWGAEGGGKSLSGNSDSGAGGKGGYSYGTISLTKGQKLYIYVGGHGKSSDTGLAEGGFNGGGSSWATSKVEPANGGGGATDISFNNGDWKSSTRLNSRIIVAGGGGGAGEDSNDNGGAGGGTSGKSTYPGTQSGTSGGGAFGIGASTPNDGGAGGGGWYGGGTTNGSQTIPTSNSTSDTSGAASGGSGYVLTSSSTKPSGYSPSSSYYLSNAYTYDGTQTFDSPSGGSETGHSGNGYARITKQ